jgi:hypothetical protein
MPEAARHPRVAPPKPAAESLRGLDLHHIAVLGLLVQACQPGRAAQPGCQPPPSARYSSITAA